VRKSRSWKRKKLWSVDAVGLTMRKRYRKIAYRHRRDMVLTWLLSTSWEHCPWFAAARQPITTPPNPAAPISASRKDTQCRLHLIHLGGLHLLQPRITHFFLASGFSDVNIQDDCTRVPAAGRPRCLLGKRAAPIPHVKGSAAAWQVRQRLRWTMDTKHNTRLPYSSITPRACARSSAAPSLSSRPVGPASN
jgi:hypothetical protein